MPCSAVRANTVWDHGRSVDTCDTTVDTRDTAGSIHEDVPFLPSRGTHRLFVFSNMESHTFDKSYKVQVFFVRARSPEEKLLRVGCTV